MRFYSIDYFGKGRIEVRDIYIPRCFDEKQVRRRLQVSVGDQILPQRSSLEVLGSTDWHSQVLEMLVTAGFVWH